MSYICCYSGYLFLGGYLFLKADISCAKCMRDFSQFLDAIAAKCNIFYILHCHMWDYFCEFDATVTARML